MSTYQYDFQTSGYAVVDKVRSIVEAQREWDFSDTIKTARAHNRNAEKKYGVHLPRSPEQRALARYLISQKAGPQISTYAWGTYADLKTSVMTGELVAT